MHPLDLIRGGFLGLLAGLLCALGGTVKDVGSGGESFKPHVFLRSPILGLLWGLAASFLTTEPILVLAFAGYFERITVEGWKLLRAKVPGKFIGGEWGRPIRRSDGPMPAIE